MISSAARYDHFDTSPQIISVSFLPSTKNAIIAADAFLIIRHVDVLVKPFFTKLAIYQPQRIAREIDK